MRACVRILAHAAIIHLVHEARGSDVNPQTIRKFGVAGDTRSVAALEVIPVSYTHLTLPTNREV